MRVILLFVLVGTVSPWCWGCCCGCCSLNIFPFLSAVSLTARIVFEALIRSGVITQRQLEADGREWAKKNRVLSRYEKFLADKEKEQEKSQKDIKEAMAALTAFFDQLAEIQNDKDMTQNNAKELTRKLTGSLTRKQSQIASFVMRQFAPHLKCQGGSPLGNLLSMFGRYNGRYKRSAVDLRPVDSSFVSTDGAIDLLKTNVDRVLAWRNDSVVLK